MALELKVNPNDDVVMKKAMVRVAAIIHKILYDFKIKKINEDVLFDKMEKALTVALELSVLRGYQLSISTLKINNFPADIITLKQAASARAKMATKLITKTSVKAMKFHDINSSAIQAAVTKKNVASRDRATGITEFEMPKMMFLGMRKGFNKITGSRRPTKRWFIVSDNPCELCQENEDEGPIPIDEPFPSGDYEPGIHVHCDCILGLYI